MTARQWQDVQPYDANGRRKYLNQVERAQFLVEADRRAPMIRALCYVLAFTGCRISEALSLTSHQLDRHEGTLIFRTLKRRRILHRGIPIPERVIAMLTALPTTADGRWWTMHRATAWEHVQAVLHVAGVRGPAACCRGLRHAFGVSAAAGHVPLPLIQRWMGHSSARTTAIYLDVVGAEERQFAQRMWCAGNSPASPQKRPE